MTAIFNGLIVNQDKMARIMFNGFIQIQNKIKTIQLFCLHKILQKCLLNYSNFFFNQKFYIFFFNILTI